MWQFGAKVHGITLATVITAASTVVSPARSQQNGATTVEYDWRAGVWTKPVKLESGKFAIIKAGNLNRACYNYEFATATYASVDSSGTYANLLKVLGALAAERSNLDKSIAGTKAQTKSDSLGQDPPAAPLWFWYREVPTGRELARRNEAEELIGQAENVLAMADSGLGVSDSLDGASKTALAAVCPGAPPRGLPTGSLARTWGVRDSMITRLLGMARRGLDSAAVAVGRGRALLEEARARILPTDPDLSARAARVEAAITAAGAASERARSAQQVVEGWVMEMREGLRPDSVQTPIWLPVDADSMRVVVTARWKSDGKLAVADTLRPPVERRHRIVLAAGPAWTTADSRDYDRGQALSDGDSAVAVIQRKEDSNSDIAPLSALLHAQVWRGLFLSVGAATRTVNRSTVIEPMAGVTLGAGDRFFLTVGFLRAARVELQRGFTECSDESKGGTASCPTIPDKVNRADFVREARQMELVFALSTRTR